MNILFISGLYPPRAKGGGELSTHLIARSLVKLGHEVTVIIEGIERQDDEYEGVKVLSRVILLTAKPLLEKRYARKQAKKLAVIIKELGEFDVVHAHDFRSAQILSEMDIGQAVVTVRDYAQVCGTTHNILADGSRCLCSISDIMKTTRFREASLLRRPFRLWQYRYNIKYRRSSFRKVPNHIYISQALLDETKEQQDLSGINSKVIFNPVPDEYLNGKVKPAVDGQVLYVGRVEEYKGVGLLLAAWKSISQSFPHAQLKIVGEGAQRQTYEQLVERSGLQYKVNFVGRIEWERIMKTYNEAEILVSPHIWSEPFGRSVVEAMARGKVVVAADSGGPGEMIENGVTGWLFGVGKVGVLGEALGRAINMRDIDRREMGGKARDWARDNLGEEKIAREYEEFYRSI